MNSSLVPSETNSYCDSCEIDFPRKSLSAHLEDYHVGPRLLDAMYICCGTCQYRVSGEKSDLMMEHCVRSNHNPSKIWTDWTSFVNVENERIVRLICSGVQFLKNDTSDSQINQEIGGHELSYRPKQKSRFGNLENVNPSQSFSNEQYITESRSSQPLPSLELSMLQSRKRSSPYSSRKWSTPKVAKSHKIKKIFNPPEMENSDENSDFTHAKDAREIKKEGHARSWSPSEVEDGAIFQRSSGQDGSYESRDPANLNATKQSTEADEETEEPKASWAVECRICNKIVCPRLKGDTLPTAFKHVFSHDKSVLPFKCINCDYKTNRKQYIERHSKTRNAFPGCNGQNVNLVDDRLRNRLRALLNYSFPDIKWDVKVPPGKLYNDIQF